VRNDDLARGLERLTDVLARIKALDPAAFIQLARLLGAADMAELARDLPWYVFATAFPGPVLAATLHCAPLRFEKLSGRLVAYREFMRMLDDGFSPAEAYEDVRDWQRQRLLDEVYLRYPESDDDLPTLTFERSVFIGVEIDASALQQEFARFLDALGVPPDQAELVILPARAPCGSYYLDLEYPDDDDYWPFDRPSRPATTANHASAGRSKPE
jgi:hypothetical protein